ncbi:hypothetical protein BX666DRAFT_1974247 [Dichotomocladium elegans]|nr:hypothetical protein BX666DRAFT_1974247 [Dichotomocladium elegans]
MAADVYSAAITEYREREALTLAASAPFVSSTSISFLAAAAAVVPPFSGDKDSFSGGGFSLHWRLAFCAATILVSLATKISLIHYNNSSPSILQTSP